MDNITFEALLKKAKLSKKEFSLKVEMHYNSVTNWNKLDKVPQWAESWLTLYIENKDLKELKEIIQKTVCDHEKSDKLNAEV